jgi:CTP synthase
MSEIDKKTEKHDSLNVDLSNKNIIKSSKTKFIFITGGVISSLGKGVAGASLGALLKSRGLQVSMQKLDPYLNTDAGTMNPQQHGEVYVTDDGAETDMDLGHYERFLDSNLPPHSCFTSGYIYTEVIKKEREGKLYDGKTIQIVPHITDMIKHYILRQTYPWWDSGGPDVVIVEIGGTVGDIEGLPFCEAVHELILQLQRDRAISIHLTYLPYLKSSGEFKTKPTQHSVKELRAVGLRPDIIICRCQEEVPPESKEKIAKTCGVLPDCIFTSPDMGNIYMLPEHFDNQKLVDKVCELLRIENIGPVNIKALSKFTRSFEKLKKNINIAIVGKYVNQAKRSGQENDLLDEGKRNSIYLESYKSVQEALCHAGVKRDAKVEVTYLEYDELSPETMAEKLSPYDGVLVPGGFGGRGMEELITTIRHLRENEIPFFGICLGLQLAVIEYAKHILKIDGANSIEFDPDCKAKGGDVIYLMNCWYEYRSGQVVFRDERSNIGGTMRLGLKPCLLVPGTKAYDAYRITYNEANKSKEAVYRYKEVALRQSVIDYRYSFHKLDPESLAKTEEDIEKRNLMTIYERHRHRYEINPAFHKRLTEPNSPGDDYFVLSGEAPSFTTPGIELPPRIVEIMELQNHPWFVGCQFHPEFLSRPLKPHPLFLGFIDAAIKFDEKRPKDSKKTKAEPPAQTS